MSWERFLRKNYERITQLGIGLKDLNTIKFQGGEHFTHQLIKFIICHHLLKLKHHFKTEQPIRNSICDIIDLDTFVIYEIETNMKPIVRRKKPEDTTVEMNKKAKIVSKYKNILLKVVCPPKRYY